MSNRRGEDLRADEPRPAGASAPGEPGYEGEAQVGEDVSGGVLESYEVPFGRDDDDATSDVPPEVRRKLEEVERQLGSAEGSGADHR
ncbi:MAG TPA: hypothetical protein VHE80_06095 [Acidimicrobiales bacterium]|nr:hypothetical protein [Acidimicrobiales bacterium]